MTAASAQRVGNNDFVRLRALKVVTDPSDPTSKGTDAPGATKMPKADGGMGTKMPKADGDMGTKMPKADGDMGT
eukprot:CAMPEP_0198114688 /NCGR_PEP_ID=MMETSP1442-20131203/6005_1 /TAXON_ID= /ORGANISM="Craspedostauros australis, Strain CCMP3328" /LENGTH=73 /DNA_ID=CAMNT_0043772059 /DNA_START=111 /DNA_END=329 /DNA_ORIENTATION=+